MDPIGTSERVEFRILGPFDLFVDGCPVNIGSAKQRLLLAALVLHVNTSVSASFLVDVLWGDAPPPSVESTLRSLISRLRKALEASKAGGLELRSTPTGYALHAPTEMIDAHRFDRLAAAGRELLARGDTREAAERLGRAVALWYGPALGEFATRDFAHPEAARLEEARLGVVEDLAEAELTVGRPGDAATRLESHLAEHPLRERAWGQLMLALYRLGRQADALRAYQHVRKVLAEELGIDPNPALRRLEQDILHQRPELNADAGRASPPGPTGRAGPVSGTVVFLFTDIEASTRRWEGDQEAMTDDLARHDALLLDAFEVGGAHVFSHTGDGLCVAFPTVGAALGAAVAGQRAVLGSPWKAALPLRVRMAVHIGAAEARGGTYLGPTLNRTARLLSTAWGGQIVCSQAAADLAHDDLPPGITLLDLGEHRLADLARPEQVYQVRHPDLPAEFPRLRSLNAQRHNLPVALTPFIGREAEVAELQAMLRGARLVTITGVGGAGKTRLALQTAAGMASSFPDGLWFVELASVRDPGLVPAEVVSALGAVPQALVGAGETLLDGLCGYLAPRRTLLVLDNCEHVIESVAEVAEAVLRRCAGVTVLATSREVLGVGGETVWRVPPLSLPASGVPTAEELEGSDAVALFCARARAVQPSFGLSAANAQAVAGICRRLDGLPLALEMAAARIRVLGANQVAQRLDDRFKLLTGGTRSAVPRHQSLRAAMEWSHELLTDAEQRVLRRLSVFSGSFDLDAAEAVVLDPGSPPAASADRPADVLDFVAHLVDKSLVVVATEEPTCRYRLLETVREFAGHQLLAAGEADAVRKAHRDFFLGLTDACRDVHGYWDHGDWVRRLDIDEDNFRDALQWSWLEGDGDALQRLVAAMWMYWLWRGDLEALAWMDRALAASGAPTPARCETLLGRAFVHRNLGHGGVQETESDLGEALRIAHALGDRRWIARVRYFFGELFVSQGHLDRGRAEIEAALAIFESLDHPHSLWSHHVLGWAAFSEGDLDAARAHFELMVRYSRMEGAGESALPHAQAALAMVAAAAGDADAAWSQGSAAVAGARGLPTSQVLLMALTRSVQASILSGQLDRAAPSVRELLALHCDLGTWRWASDVLDLAAVALTRTHPEAAATLFAKSDALRGELDEPATPGILRQTIDRAKDDVRATLGPDEPRCRKMGQAMTVEESLRFALSNLT